MEECVEDCTKAVELQPDYAKAYSRRAIANEKLEHLDAALDDYKKVLQYDSKNREAHVAVMRLPQQIEEQREKMKKEMFSKLKDLGDMCLRPFGLSTNNFQMVQDPNTGSYSINFVQNAGAAAASASASSNPAPPPPAQQ